MNETDKYDEIGDTLEITKMTRRTAGSGTWVIGTILGHRFDALVFPTSAENPDYEIPGSRVSKLWIQRLADKTTVFNWDRGQDVEAQTEDARAIVDFLAAGLADTAYPNIR